MAARRCWSGIQCWKKLMPSVQFSYTLSGTVLSSKVILCHGIQTHTTVPRFVTFILFSFIYKQANLWIKTIRMNQTPQRIHQKTAVRMTWAGFSPEIQLEICPSTNIPSPLRHDFPGDACPIISEAIMQQPCCPRVSRTSGIPVG